MILIIVEPNYANSMWCQNLVSSLVSELKTKRITYRFISDLDKTVADCKFIYVIGSNTAWIKAVLETCSALSIYPILLCNQAYHDPEITYSTVCSDIRGSVQYLIDALSALGRTSIALYGVNPHSVSDESRLRCFQAATQHHDLSNVFINDGSLMRCFNTFKGEIQNYQAVICANDFAAISLVRNLMRDDPSQLKRIVIVGCAETRLTELYSKYILSVRNNFQEFGKIAVALLDSLKRNPFLSHVVMAVRWDFSPLTSPHTISRPSHRLNLASMLPDSEDTFYRDEELENMLCVERILSESDDVDRKIISGLLQGISYESISEQCYITVSAVKYRISKMISLSGRKNRKELTQLLQIIWPE